LWNPWQYGGVLIHADPQAQIFYPFTWIAILAGNHTAGRNLFYWVEWMVPLHMIIAGVFAFALLRCLELSQPAAWMGASVYQLGGYFASQAQHLGAICCGAWLPLAVLAVFKLRQQVRARWIAILAITFSMSILSGFMASTLVVFGMAAFTALVLLVFDRANWRLLPSIAASAVWGALIAGVTFYPAWQLSKLSMASLRSLFETDGAGLPVQSLVSLVLPNYYHIFEPLSSQYHLHMNFTSLYVYCGIVALLLLAGAPFCRSRLLFVSVMLIAVSAIWMMGEHTAVFRFVFKHLPDLIRASLYAFVAMMAFGLFVGMTAAIVLDKLGKRVPAGVIWLIALVSSADLIHAGAGRPMDCADGSWKKQTSEYDIGGFQASLTKLRKLVGVASPPLRFDYANRDAAEG
jgi:hypothetical protein